jgi:hypothetical protein
MILVNVALATCVDYNCKVKLKGTMQIEAYLYDRKTFTVQAADQISHRYDNRKTFLKQCFENSIPVKCPITNFLLT